MKERTKIILPVIIFFGGLLTVFFGRQGQVSADVYSTFSNNLYTFLIAIGFFLIAIAAIITLFIIANSESKK